MRFTIKAGELASVLNSLSGLAKGQTIPILGCVKITAEDAHLQVEATDLATRSTCRWPATPTSVGATCVNANRLLGLMRGLPSSMVVEITGTKEHLTIKGHRSRYRLAALSEFDFPQRPDAVANTTCQFPAGALHRGLSAVIKVVDNMAATGSMSSGASITITEGCVESIAAEAGRVTYVREFSEDIHAAGPISTFVNRNTGKELLRLLGEVESDSTVFYAHGDQYDIFKAGDRELILQRYQMNFPESAVRALLKERPDETRVTVNREGLKAMIDRVAVAMDSEFDSDRFQIKCTGRDLVATVSRDSNAKGSKDALKAASRAAKGDEEAPPSNAPRKAYETIAEESLESAGMADMEPMTFQLRYFTDVVDRGEGETAELYFGGPANPLRLQLGAGVTAILAPMRD